MSPVDRGGRRCAVNLGLALFLLNAARRNSIIKTLGCEALEFRCNRKLTVFDQVDARFVGIRTQKYLDNCHLINRQSREDRMR